MDWAVAARAAGTATGATARAGVGWEEPAREADGAAATGEAVKAAEGWAGGWAARGPHSRTWFWW